MLVIRLQRTGRKNSPTFRLVLAEHSAPVKGKFIEVFGHYLPTRDPFELDVKEDRIRHWVSMGAIPSNTVARLLLRHGMVDMEKFTETYTKKKPRNAVEEEAPPPPAPPPEATAPKKPEEAVSPPPAEETVTPQEAEEPGAPDEKVKTPAEEVPVPSEESASEKTSEEDAANKAPEEGDSEKKE